MSTAELRGWRRVRRVAVPPAMIEASARLRAAGDWRGACAAANVDVDVDPAAVSALDLQARDERGRTPLLHAIAEGGTPELISALLALGASPSGSGASISVVPPG